MLIRLDEVLKEQLLSCAKDQDLSASQLVRKIIREYVKKNYQGDLFAAVETAKRAKLSRREPRRK